MLECLTERQANLIKHFSSANAIPLHPVVSYRTAEYAYDHSAYEFEDTKEAFIAGYHAAREALRADREPTAKTVDSTQAEPEIIASRVTERVPNKEHQGLQKTDKPNWCVKTKLSRSFKGAIRPEVETNVVRIQRLCVIAAKNSPYHKAEIEDCLNLVLNELINQVLEGKRVILDRFGGFSLKYNKPRKIVNPFYGVAITDPSVSLKFDINRDFRRFLRSQSESILLYLNEYKEEVDQRKKARYDARTETNIEESKDDSDCK